MDVRNSRQKLARQERDGDENRELCRLLFCCDGQRLCHLIDESTGARQSGVPTDNRSFGIQQNSRGHRHNIEPLCEQRFVVRVQFVDGEMDSGDFKTFLRLVDLTLLRPARCALFRPKIQKSWMAGGQTRLVGWFTLLPCQAMTLSLREEPNSAKH